MFSTLRVHIIANRQGRKHQSSVELGSVVQLEQYAVVSAAPAARVGQVEPAVLVVQAENKLLAQAAPVEGRPSMAAMACQQVAEA
jgi:hypothetical protein